MAQKYFQDLFSHGCHYQSRGKEQTMIKYLIDVIKYMRKIPCGNSNRRIWLRNCLYVNWQKPWKWNLDIYWLWKQVERSRR